MSDCVLFHTQGCDITGDLNIQMTFTNTKNTIGNIVLYF